uniref:Uncharacterized protein n=1 Tax=Strongyloides papillosus TaxID=174720 RepID=A0A0N5B8X2_STREA
MTSKWSGKFDNQFLMDFLSDCKGEEYKSNVVQCNIEKIFQDFVSLYDNEQKIIFYRWIEKGNERQLDNMQSFKNIITGQLIDRKLHDVFDVPEEVAIPEKVITEISIKLVEMFKKSLKRSKECSLVVPLDEESSWSDDKGVNYLDHIKKEILLCDDQSIKLMDYFTYTGEDNIGSDSEKKLREMLMEEIFTEEEVYNKTAGISDDSTTYAINKNKV